MYYVVPIVIPKKKEVSTNTITIYRLHSNLRTDGLDCGDDVAALFSEALGETDVRLLMYSEGLFTERTCVPHSDWWNNNVPKRRDDCAYADLAPYMITTQASLDDLNSKLENDTLLEVTSLHFRPVIVVDQCPAWDEDKWIDLQIGDAKLQCFKPCTRRLMIMFRFRLAPEGPMRQQFKDSPIFGVNAGVDRPGHIHVGQTVYARYKKSAF
ncbi:MOSC domain protein [Ancylostoma ceylanicum]|uniref:MOSC domain protein n=1 Tax=Ancylostoma ceylanicum TaxID=53326 RepID=A0A0D6LYH4_9BILA|nr:MOSC domain protein [Ancylostoma ceylanicum]